MGLGHIPSSEYESWARQNRIELSLSELAILKALDRAYVVHHNSKSAGGQQPVAVSAQPITTYLFDHMFQ